MAAQWHYSKGGERHGPVSSDQLRQLAASGQLGPTDLVWRDGMAEWQKASSVKGLFPSQTSGPTEPPPIPLTPPPEADPASTTPEPAAGRSEKRGLLGTLSSLGHAAKTAAVVAAKEAERAKINNVDLPKAYAALGRDVHGRGAYREEFSGIYHQIDDLLARLRNLEGEPPKQSNSPATFADKAKAAAVATKQKAEVQAMRLQLSRLMNKLGEAAYERHGTAAGSPETTGPIASLLSRASTLDAEVEQQRQASGGRFITRRRALAAAGVFCACVILLGVVGKMAPNSHNTPNTEADASQAALTPVRQLAEDTDTPISQPQPHDFSKDDYDSIPKGATRATTEEQLENGKWIVSQGYRLSDGTFVSHGPNTVWWDKARTKKAGNGADLNGKLHGVLTKLYPNGAREAEVTFVHGLRHGLEREWYDDGTKKRERSWANGKRHGPSRAWYPNGQLEAEGSFLNDNLHGLDVGWNEDGTKKCEHTYRNGVRHGPHRMFGYYAGQQYEIQSGAYTDGKVTGTWRFGFPSTISNDVYFGEATEGPWRGGTRFQFLVKLRYEAQKDDGQFAGDPRRGVTRAYVKRQLFSETFGPPDNDLGVNKLDRQWYYNCSDGTLRFDVAIDPIQGLLNISTEKW